MLDYICTHGVCVISGNRSAEQCSVSPDDLSSTAAWRVATRSNPGGPVYVLYEAATFLFNDVGDVVKFTALDGDKVTRA